MATIQRHPEVEDFFLEMTLDEIAARPVGVSDLIETGRLVVIKDYRLPFDAQAIAQLNGHIDHVPDGRIARKLKKLKSTSFFEGAVPNETRSPDGVRSLSFADPMRQAVYDHLCGADADIFDRASAALSSVHDELERVFAIAFPHYRATSVIPSLRLTETLFENLHWDNHSIDDDFHQARVFCNLDAGRRIWNVSHNFLTFMEQVYDAHDLGRFAGKDPNLVVDYICGTILGGTRESWRDTLPRHRIAFETGEVWLGESRLISHQICYGQRAAVYMWFVDAETMSDSRNRFNARVEALHEKMSARQPVAA